MYNNNSNKVRVFVKGIVRAVGGVPENMGAKGLVESEHLNSTPPDCVLPSDRSRNDHHFQVEEEIPTIDFSKLTAGTPDQRSDAVQAIGKACREWGFFVVINHSMPEKLMDEMLEVTKRFFDLTEEEKKEYAGKEPIKCGTGFGDGEGKMFLWRDYLKVHVHPHFHAPRKPPGFRDTSEEYCKKAREVSEELLKGISRSLGQEEDYIQKKIELESSSSSASGRLHQLLVVNAYPTCPRPELVMGMPPHSDHAILTLLTQNHVCGLEIRHNGNWLPVDAPPYSLLVNTGDFMEILTNGRYKSVVHRVVVSREATRITVGTGLGPAMDAIVGPAAELVDRENNPPKYRRTKYRDYVQVQQANLLNGKSCLDHVRI